MSSDRGTPPCFTQLTIFLSLVWSSMDSRAIFVLCLMPSGGITEGIKNKAMRLISPGERGKNSTIRQAPWECGLREVMAGFASHLSSSDTHCILEVLKFKEVYRAPIYSQTRSRHEFPFARQPCYLIWPEEEHPGDIFRDDVL
jgi:hypothetical protein